MMQDPEVDVNMKHETEDPYYRIPIPIDLAIIKAAEGDTRYFDLFLQNEKIALKTWVVGGTLLKRL